MMEGVVTSRDRIGADRVGTDRVGTDPVGTDGDRIGRYRLLRTLGEGGMGVVHLAADSDGRKVAIKVLRSSVAGDATARRRLAREVDSMRRVHNPHVAEILDADVTADRPYIVTQYVPGRTLEEIVEDVGPVHGAALQRLAVGLAAALSAIHGAGIIHRDMKPGNVMLVDGEPIVIDFGIAQGTDATRLTATGMVIGTPGYLAPEIIEGEEAGMPSDVHAWAGTLAYAATGRPPFGSGTFESIFYKIMQGAPDLDGMPDALLPLIRAAMARNPAERPTAVKLVQLTRRIHLEATITDQTRVDRPAHRTVEQRPLDEMQIFAQPAPPAPRPEPAPAQPKDFKGLLPPAAPPPAQTNPYPTPAPYRPQSQYGMAQGAHGAQGPGAQQGPPPPYDPYAGPRHHPPVAAPAAQPATPPAKPYGWYRILSVAALAGLLGFAASVPILGLLAALGAALVLRAGDRSAKNMESRRTLRGPSSGDMIGAVLKSPLALPRATLTTALLVPLGLIVGIVLLMVLIIVNPQLSVARAVSYGAMAVIVVLFMGPGGTAPRRQMARVWGFFLPRREPAMVVAVVLGVFAAVLLMLGLSPDNVPDTRPLTGLVQQLDDFRDWLRDLLNL